MKLDISELSFLHKKLTRLFPDKSSEIYNKLGEVESTDYKYLLAMYYQKEKDIIKQVLNLSA